MEEQRITFETAKLAKEKGYSQYSFGGDVISSKGETSRFNEYYIAPTQSLLQKWLREKHNIQMYTKVFSDARAGETFVCDAIMIPNGRVKKSFRCKTYELALEEALINALKLIEPQG